MNINAYMNPHGEIVADALPVVGDTLTIRDFGAARVERLYHTTTRNYIVIKYAEVVAGMPDTHSHPFSLQE